MKSVVAAINQPNAFTNQVQALIQSGRLDAVSGQASIDSTREIIESINRW